MMRTSEDLGTEPVPSDPALKGRNPGIHRVDLPEDDEVLYLVYDEHRKRVARIFLPLDLACEETEERMAEWLDRVPDMRRVAHQPFRPKIVR